MNQNRRNDVLIHPAVGDFNIRMFLSFVQADGYNPLQVATTNFMVSEEKVVSLVAQLGITEDYTTSQSGSITISTMADNLKKMLTKPFRIGQLFKDMKNAGISFKIDRNDFLNKVIQVADQASAAAFMQNGYWCDVSTTYSASSILLLRVLIMKLCGGQEFNELLVSCSLMSCRKITSSVVLC